MNLDTADRRLLEEIQRDLPFCRRPFAGIGERCGLSEEEVILRLEKLLSDGKPENVEEVATLVSAHPGVSHNYLRNHSFNLWFTLAIPERKDFKEELEKLFSTVREGIHGYLILPALRTFKIGINFRLSGDSINRRDETPTRGDRSSSIARGLSGCYAPGSYDPPFVLLNSTEKRVLAVLEEDFPLSAEPWRMLADRAGLNEEDFIEIVEKLKSRGAVKRISGILRHRHLGFDANGMACFSVPEDEIALSGEKAAEFQEVTHCYQRPTFPEWPYSLFCMVHANKREECERIVGRIAEEIGCSDYTILYSTREFKKERVKYFIRV